MQEKKVKRKPRCSVGVFFIWFFYHHENSSKGNARETKHKSSRSQRLPRIIIMMTALPEKHKDNNEKIAPHSQRVIVLYTFGNQSTSLSSSSSFASTISAPTSSIRLSDAYKEIHEKKAKIAPHWESQITFMDFPLLRKNEGVLNSKITFSSSSSSSCSVPPRPPHGLWDNPFFVDTTQHNTLSFEHDLNALLMTEEDHEQINNNNNNTFCSSNHHLAEEPKQEEEEISTPPPPRTPPRTTTTKCRMSQQQPQECKNNVRITEKKKRKTMLDDTDSPRSSFHHRQSGTEKQKRNVMLDDTDSARSLFHHRRSGREKKIRHMLESLDNRNNSTGGNAGGKKKNEKSNKKRRLNDVCQVLCFPSYFLFIDSAVCFLFLHY